MSVIKLTFTYHSKNFVYSCIIKCATIVSNLKQKLPKCDVSPLLRTKFLEYTSRTHLGIFIQTYSAEGRCWRWSKIMQSITLNRLCLFLWTTFRGDNSGMHHLISSYPLYRKLIGISMLCEVRYDFTLWSKSLLF